MKISGVYQIQSKIKLERIYIGSTVNINTRWKDHLKTLRRNQHHSLKLQRHYNKYGESDLQFSILLGCEREDLIKTEQYFIDSYKPYFNNSPTAGSCLGNKWSDQQKKRRSELYSGKTHPMFGKHHAEEAKRKNSEWHKEFQSGENHPFFGRQHTDETKKKMSDAKKNKPLSEEHKISLSKNHIGMEGKHHSVEAIKKISEGHKGIKCSEETKRKISKFHKGKNFNPPISDEGRRKMSEARKRYWMNKKIA